MRAATAKKQNPLDELATAAAVPVPTANPFIGPMPEQKPVAAAPVSGKWKVSLHDNYYGLESIWRRLETEGHCTVFQMYDWVACWYDTVVSNSEAEPLIAVVYKEDSSPAWILPLCVHYKNSLKIITFADLGVADYTGPVMAPGLSRNKNVIREMINAVIRALPSCDVINFQKISDRIDGVPNPLLHICGVKRFSVQCHGISLTEPWPQLGDKIVQRRLWTTIKRQHGKLAKCGAVAIDHHTGAQNLAPFLETLMDLRKARLGTIGLPDMQPVWKNFYRNLIARQGNAFSPTITTLSVGGESIATCFGLVRGKTYYAILPTFKMGKWESYRPGMLLFDAMLTSFAEQTQGQGYFDFTVGDENYKKRLGCESHPLYELTIPRSIKGVPVYILWRFKVFARRYPRLLEAAKDIRDRIRGTKSAELSD